jgi:uncharacterized protein (TIGR02271 family)
MKRCFTIHRWRRIKLPEKENSKHNHPEDETLQLHREELQVRKKWVETADVKAYKNIYTKVKEIKVPVTYEELVIEKRILNPKSAFEEDHEIIRIPLSEERIEVSLIPTILEDVEIYKEQIEEVMHFNEILKEEKIHIETVGDIKVTGNDTQLG